VLNGLRYLDRTKYEANDQSYGSTHHATHLDWTLLANVQSRVMKSLALIES
jgi:hypothetical protein